ncbi:MULTISPECIES: prepilin peptidase [Corynebacterium]|uniref:prepilin peptidase n=1 Tax=Corynebacterium TaxID=1716 RepID=UPI00178C2FC5|nr:MULTISPECIES: prepilin peptidase [Corynebacterium]
MFTITCAAPGGSVQQLLLSAICVLLILAAGWDRVHARLPNALTLPAILMALVLFPAAWWGGLLWGASYGLAWWRGWGIGGGDVKLAVSLGIIAAAQGALVLPWVIAGAALLTLIDAALQHRQLLPAAAARGRVPHGPGMVSATLMAALLCAEV